MTESNEENPRAAGKPIPPTISATAFCCPHCGAYTHQYWYRMYVEKNKEGRTPSLPPKDYEEILSKSDISLEQKEYFSSMFWKLQKGEVFFEKADTSYSTTEARNLSISRCFTCGDIAVWVYNKLVHPPVRTGPQPNEDLPDDIKKDFEEARSILSLSPRGAAALLRLCIQKLCVVLGGSGKNIDEDVGALVKKGMDRRVQKSLDAGRVIGNESVHPGQIDLRDDPDTAAMLFKLVNLIAERMISEPKHIEAVYDLLPESKKQAIERRDKEES